MGHLFLLNDDLLRQDLHGVYPASVSFSYLEYLTECALTDQLEDLEVLRTIVLLVSLVEVQLQMYLAGDVVAAFPLPRLELEPAIVRMLVFD